jgi:hypothetical protein
MHAGLLVLPKNRMEANPVDESLQGRSPQGYEGGLHNSSHCFYYEMLKEQSHEILDSFPFLFSTAISLIKIGFSGFFKFLYLNLT